MPGLYVAANLAAAGSSSTASTSKLPPAAALQSDAPSKPMIYHRAVVIACDASGAGSVTVLCDDGRQLDVPAANIRMPRAESTANVAAGTRLFGFLAESRGPEDFARPLFVVASLFLLAPVIAPSNYVLALVAFLLFEGVVGCYFPALGTLKSKIVPDAQRSTIYNIFRVPLNVLVLLVLLSKLPTQTVFAVSALLLLSAAILQHMLFAAMRGHADVLDAHGVDAKDPLVSV